MFGYYRGRGILKLVVAGGVLYGAFAGAQRLMAGADNAFVLFGLMVGAAFVLGVLVYKLWS